FTCFLFLDVTRSHTLYASENPVAVGNNVTLSSNYNVSSGGWLFNTRQIVITLYGGVVISKTWHDRVSFNKSTSSLTIHSVKLEDSGNYALQDVIDEIFSQLTLSVEGKRTLIFLPLQNIIVEAPMMPAKEGYSYNLTCNTNVPADYIYWMKNGEPLNQNNNIVFYNDNKTLHIRMVERYDNARYECMLFRYSSISFSVTDGPETPFVYGPAFAETGHQAVFSCSAESVPPCTFCWWFNGSIVANTSNYTTDVLSLSMSGEYKCMAINNVTGKNSTNSTTLTVIGMKPLGFRGIR
uniref:Ig-like domain-containing protein n=1 Tax=Neolamprologus brichardi TaxID=32507 RepID=A0A3Q4MAC3_NEOBR